MAVGLAQGKTVRELAVAMGRSENTLYWHLKRIYRKLSISRQTDLVRLVLSIPEDGVDCLRRSAAPYYEKTPMPGCVFSELTHHDDDAPILIGGEDGNRRWL